MKINQVIQTLGRVKNGVLFEICDRSNRTYSEGSDFL